VGAAEINSLRQGHTEYVLESDDNARSFQADLAADAKELKRGLQAIITVHAVLSVFF